MLDDNLRPISMIDEAALKELIDAAFDVVEAQSRVRYEVPVVVANAVNRLGNALIAYKSKDA